jgi:uncharacterized protein (TIGR02145 family)
MRKLLLTTAAVAAAIGLAVAGEPSFGTFTDTRDGQTYKTVTIGIQAWVTVIIGGQTWMAENLNYKTDSSWCYENTDSNCVKYGRLYAWNAARKACPVGYHLPSHQEWIKLSYYVGGWKTAGSALKAASGWNSNANGKDIYGFTALPGGERCAPNVEMCPGDGFYSAGYSGTWWTVTKYTEKNVGDYILTWYIYKDNDIAWNSENSDADAYSVRCVADRP